MSRIPVADSIYHRMLFEKTGLLYQAGITDIPSSCFLIAATIRLSVNFVRCILVGFKIKDFSLIQNRQKLDRLTSEELLLQSLAKGMGIDLTEEAVSVVNIVNTCIQLSNSPNR
jgi:hypothetical protein